MTREKAKEIISYHRYLVDKDKSGLLDKELEYQAIDMAIKALEQEPREITLEDVKEYCKPRCLTIITDELLYELTHPKIKALEQAPCEDCVSRQKVIDALTKTSGIRGDALKALYDLPPVTPKPKMRRWIDKDGISDFMYCSNCGGKKHYSEKWIGCPYCLADMRESYKGESEE